MVFWIARYAVRTSRHNPQTGAPHPKGQNPGGTDETLLAMELAGTVPARGLVAGARIRVGDGFGYTVVSHKVNGNVIIRREILKA